MMQMVGCKWYDCEWNEVYGSVSPRRGHAPSALMRARSYSMFGLSAYRSLTSCKRQHRYHYTGLRLAAILTVLVVLVFAAGLVSATRLLASLFVS